jgi:hypothetical protein
LAFGEEMNAKIWIATGIQDGNLIAQFETILAVTTGILGEGSRVEVCMSDDIGSKSAPRDIVVVHKRLEKALDRAMQEGKDKNRQGDPVESYPLILESSISKG